MKRIITSLVFLPVFVWIVWLPVWVYFLLLAAVVVLAVHEVAGLARHRRLSFSTFAVGLAATGILFSFLDPRLDPIVAVGAILSLFPLLLLGNRGPLDRAVVSMGTMLLTVVVLGVLMGFQLRIRILEEEIGQHLVFYFFLVVWAGDTAAYYVGSLIGKHLLMPGISPGKTIQGSIGGSIASMAIGAGGAGWLVAGINPLQGAIIGFLLNGFGQSGDLLESSLKRVAGVKDSATILPGHGGILDRLDSLALAGPVFYLCCLWVWG
jgi:phosphatidate cytidylyltransferase